MQLSEGSTFLRIAHRGASAYEPENTLRSFKRAVELKSDMIEFDVRQSLDGSLVVIHDTTVDRTTNGTGLVSQKSLAELRELDAGMGEKILTLEEVLEFGRGKMSCVIELKEDGIEGKVVNLVKDFGLAEEVLIVSFKSVRLKMVKELEPGLKTGLILFASLNPMRLAQKCGADAVAPFHWFVTKRMADNARRNGLHLFTWTVDEAGKAQQLKDIGVTGIVTNKPDLIQV